MTKPPAPTSSRLRWRLRSSRSPSTRVSSPASSQRRFATPRRAPASTPPPASTRTCSRPGVADPVKVTRSALQNAASIAALFLDDRSGRRRQAGEGRRTSWRPDRWYGRNGLLKSPTFTKRPGPHKGSGFFVRINSFRRGCLELQSAQGTVHRRQLIGYSAAVSVDDAAPCPDRRGASWTDATVR